MDQTDKYIMDVLSREVSKPRTYQDTIRDALYKNNIYKSSNMNLLKIAATFILAITICIGVVYASVTVYESIMNNIEKIDNIVGENIITEEDEARIVTEEEIRKIASNKLKDFGYDDEVISKAELYKDAYSIDWRIYTENELILIFNALNGELSQLTDDHFDKSLTKYRSTVQEAIITVQEMYNKLGFKEGEYNLIYLDANVHDDPEENAYFWTGRFAKNYDGMYNEYEGLWIGFYPEINRLKYLTISNSKFEENPINVSKEEAIEIVKNKDAEVEQKREIEKVEVLLAIEKSNTNAYAREHDTENYYKPMVEADVPQEDLVYYKINRPRVRRVWAVSIKYKELEGGDIFDRYVYGQYSYFVDTTTGEIIGGTQSNYADSVRGERNYNFLNKYI